MLAQIQIYWNLLSIRPTQRIPNFFRDSSDEIEKRNGSHKMEGGRMIILLCFIYLSKNSNVKRKLIRVFLCEHANFAQCRIFCLPQPNAKLKSRIQLFKLCHDCFNSLWFFLVKNVKIDRKFITISSVPSIYRNPWVIKFVIKFFESKSIWTSLWWV